MKRIETLVIGAGQAGLAMSCCLSDRAIPHVVLERGAVANSWRHERWDSLRMLTPNWQSRLPGYRYQGTDPDGFMSMPEVVGIAIGMFAGGLVFTIAVLYLMRRASGPRDAYIALQ